MFRAVVTLFKWLAAGAALALLLLLSANNPQPVSLSLLPFPYETRLPLFLLAVLAFCAGMLCGGVFISLRHIRARRETARLRNRVAALENEIAGLKHDSH